MSRTRRLSRYGWSTRSLSIRYVKRKTFNPSRCVFNAPILQLSDWWPSSNLYYAPDCACGEQAEFSFELNVNEASSQYRSI